MIMRYLLRSVIVLGFSICLMLMGCGEKPRPLSEILQEATAMMQAGQLDSAILLLEQAQERFPDRLDVLEPLAFAHSANGDPIMAALIFVQMAELAEERAEYLLYAANALKEAGDRSGASARYREFLLRHPRDRANWVALAELELEQGRNRPALEAFLQAEQIESRTVQQVAIGSIYLQLNNLAQAQTWYARALTGDAGFRDRALLGLLETAVRAKRFGDAELLVEQLDEEFPGSLDSSAIAAVRQQLLEWRALQEEAEAAVAAIDAGGRRTVSAAEDVAEDAETEPQEPAGAAPVAAADADVDSQERAADSVPGGEVAAAPVPADAGPDVIAQEKIEQPAQMPTEAAPVADVGVETAAEPAAAARQPRTALSWLQEARELRRAEAFEQAIQAYRQSLVLDDRPAGVWTELSETYFLAQQFRLAQVTASEAVRREPEVVRHTLQLLLAGQQAWDADRLLREMETAYRRFPGQPDIILLLGRLFDEGNNLRNARRLYEEFLQVAPDSHPGYRWTEQRLRQLAAG